ncbi:MAG: hypothetical protein ABIS50_16185 [Luteolibacter sp.]|uniref:hypothetical protein n=1 Tax=Luteolibacter sp. TaxID=1962973 RepID=UPI003264DE27
MDETNRLPLPNRDRPLYEVIQDFGRRLRPGGPDGEIDEWSVYDESFRRLVAWTGETGRFFEGLQALKEGGREHDLTYDPATASWLKFTKPAHAGYVVSFEFGAPTLEPALPLEYLERLLLQNEIFNDQVTFVGIGGQRVRPTIITRQADIPGEPADHSEIIHLMTRELGFELLPARHSVGYQDSLAFVRDGIAVFDLRPANVVRTPDGVIVPIDSIPVRLNEKEENVLRNG